MRSTAVHLSTRIALVGLLTVGIASIQAQTPGWSLSSRPQLEIGTGLDGEAAYQFSRISTAKRLASGRIIVVNEAEIRYFDREGRHVKTAGRKGGGPGEFQYISQVFVTAGDSLLVWDAPRRTRSWFDGEGNFVRSDVIDVRGVERGDQVMEVAQLLPNGRFFGHLIGSAPQRPTSIYRPQAPYLVFDAPDTKVVELGTYGGIAQMRVDVGGRLRNVIVPLGTRTHAIIGPERIYIGDNATYDIHIFDFDGRRVGSARSARPATPVTPRHLAEYRERALVANVRDDASRRRFEQEWRVVSTPRTLPFFTALMADSRGRLWVRDWSANLRDASRWTVFDRDGREISHVAFPARVRPLDAGSDWVLAEHVDELDVPSVRLYGLTTGSLPR